MAAVGGIIDAMAQRAQEFLGGLSGEQRVLATHEFGDAERQRWFCTPTDHGGLPLGDCDDEQRVLAMRLLALGLSGPGYRTAASVMSLEVPLELSEGFRLVDGRRAQGSAADLT